MRQDEKAKQLLTTSLEISKKNQAEHFSAYTTTINNLASIYQVMGQYEKAEVFYNLAKDITKKHLGENDHSYSVTLSNLAGLYQTQGQYEKAEPLLLQRSFLVKQNLLSSLLFMSELEKQIYLRERIAIDQVENSYLFNYRRASLGAIIAFCNTQLFFKGLILDNTRSMLTALQESNDTSIQSLFIQWQGNRRILSKQYTLPIEKRREDVLRGSA